MSLVTTPYFHIECNGPAPTPRHPHCTATADGGWIQEEVEAAARDDGWIEDGRKWLCPKHAPAPDASSGPAPKTPRKPKTPLSPGAFEDQGHQG